MTKKKPTRLKKLGEALRRFQHNDIVKAVTTFLSMKGLSYKESANLDKGKEKEEHFLITPKEFHDRARNFGAELFKMTYSFIKVIALTTATIILIRLLLQVHFHGSQLDYAILLTFLLWTVSFIVLLITYDAAMFGSIFIITIPPAWVTVLPVFFAVCEFLAFAILSAEFFFPEFKEYKLVNAGSWWFLINGVYHVLISAFCWKGVRLCESNYRILANDASHDGQTEDTYLQKIYLTYRNLLDKERSGSLLAGYISLIVFAISYYLITHADTKSIKELEQSISFWQCIVAFFLIALVSFAYHKQHEKRREINKRLDKELKLTDNEK